MNDRSFFQPERDKYLSKIEKKAQQRHIPIIKPEVGQFLEVIIKASKPHRILEIGTAVGYSTIWMARATEPETEIVTIEIDEERVAEARENFCYYGFEERINLKIGDALEILPYLRRNFDLVFIDAAKGQYLNYLDLVMNLIPPGGLIIADNVLYHGYVNKNGKIKHKRRTLVKTLRDYIDFVTDHQYLSTSILPLGDGIALSVVLKE